MCAMRAAHYELCDYAYCYIPDIIGVYAPTTEVKNLWRMPSRQGMRMINSHRITKIDRGRGWGEGPYTKTPPTPTGYFTSTGSQKIKNIAMRQLLHYFIRYGQSKKNFARNC